LVTSAHCFLFPASVGERLLISQSPAAIAGIKRLAYLLYCMLPKRSIKHIAFSLFVLTILKKLMRNPLPAYHFIVDWGGTSSGFTEISGLSMETEVIDYCEGNSPDQRTQKLTRPEQVWQCNPQTRHYGQ
jgi:hypothetical protein